VAVGPTAGSCAGGSSELAVGPTATKDPLVLAMSHVYLGRIYDDEGEHDRAAGEYRAAMGVEGAPESARQAAQRALNRKK